MGYMIQSVEDRIAFLVGKHAVEREAMAVEIERLNARVAELERLSSAPPTSIKG